MEDVTGSGPKVGGDTRSGDGFEPRVTPSLQRASPKRPAWVPAVLGMGVLVLGVVFVQLAVWAFAWFVYVVDQFWEWVPMPPTY